jgi:hypothetical protein
MKLSAKTICPNNQQLIALKKEDDLYSWKDMKPEYQNGTGKPHHSEMPSWAGSLQKELGPHRRGPNRNWF